MPQSRFALSAAFVLMLSLPAAAAEVDAQASYILTLGGINIAAMNVDLNDNGRSYSLDLDANVAGFGAVVASGTAKASSQGASASNGLVSQSFDLQTRAQGEVFTVDVTFAGRDVSSFQVEPPIVDNYDRVPIERNHLSGAGDFLSAFVLKGGALDKSLCQRKVGIFTGVERFNIAMSYAPAIRGRWCCALSTTSPSRAISPPLRSPITWRTATASSSGMPPWARRAISSPIACCWAPIWAISPWC